MTDLQSTLAADLASPFALLTARRRQRDSGTIIYPERVFHVRLKDTARHSSNHLSISLDNADGLLWGDDLLMRTGTLIHLAFGYPSMERDAGDFVIKKHKPSGTAMEIVCHEAKRNRHSRKPNTREWTHVKRSDVVRQTLARMGYSGSTAEIDESNVVLPIIMQCNQGDYQFLESLAEDEAKEFWLDDSGAHWVEPRRGKKPSNRYRYKKGLIGVGNVIGEPTIEGFSAYAPGRIRARGIDPATGEEFMAVAADSSDLNERVKGLIKLNESDNIQTPEDGDEDAAGNDGFAIEVNIGARSKAEAKIAVDSLFKKYRYGALKVKIPLIGDPFLFPRSVVEVWGLGPAVDGYFYVKEVDHDLSPGAVYKTTVELNKDGLNRKVQIPNNAAANPYENDLSSHLPGRG